MFLHLGQDTLVAEDDIIGIFDLDNTTQSARTRQFLTAAERAGRVVTVSEELPKSFVLCTEDRGALVYISQLSSQTLWKRQQYSHWQYPEGFKKDGKLWNKNTVN